MDEKVTVVIPVGPFEANQRWLEEAIESVEKQTYPVDQLLIVDDMAGLPRPHPWGDKVRTNVWASPWRLGVASAFNFGIAMADNELVFMLGSDDWLEPQCIEACVRTYRTVKDPGSTFFFVGVKYDDGREDDTQFTPCGAAMVTQSLWKQCGGFPLETASGASDAALVSIMIKNPGAGTYIGVNRSRPLYNYRVHDGTDTAQRQPWQGVILKTRDILTATWKKPEWTKRRE